MRILGRVEYYNPTRGFGFVIDADGSGVNRFFHKSHVVSGTPMAGRLAQYEPGATSKGPVALDMEVFQGASGATIPVSVVGLDGDSK